LLIAHFEAWLASFRFSPYPSYLLALDKFPNQVGTKGFRGFQQFERVAAIIATSDCSFLKGQGANMIFYKIPVYL
jgi:hypothetical protein